MRTAESVVFTLCPPGPEERNTSMRRSLGSIWTSTSSASGSTATVTVEVWMRPCASVGGHALHAVHAALVLETAVDPVPADRDDRLLHAAAGRLRDRERLELPATPLGVARVHAQQVGREERGLVPAGAGADLEHHVLVVVGILGHQQQPELPLERRDLRLEARELDARQLAHLGVGIVDERARVLALGERRAVARRRRRAAVAGRRAPSRPARTRPGRWRPPGRPAAARGAGRDPRTR